MGVCRAIIIIGAKQQSVNRTDARTDRRTDAQRHRRTDAQMHVRPGSDTTTSSLLAHATEETHVPAA